MPSSLLTWDTARAAGFVAYLLTTASVAVGLALSLRWRGGLWTRYVTTELHRFVTLLSLVFLAVHGVSVLIDPFIRFTPADVLVPLVAHYRPIWVALGIVAGYLLVAIWLSERIQKRIGYAWWRRLHYLTFLGFLLATMHGIATGSDTRTLWGLAVYGGSLAVVGALLAVRLFVPGPQADARQAAAVLGVAVVCGLVLFTVAGPLRPGWNAAAGGAITGSTASQAVAGTQATPSAGGAGSLSGAAATPDPAAPGLAAVQGRFFGTLDPNSLVVDGQLPDGGTVQLQLAGGDDGQGGLAVTGAQVALQEPNAPACRGSLQATGDALAGTCSTADGRTMNVQIGLRGGDDGRIRGTIVATPA